MKVTISLNDELMSRIDQYGKENYLSRSGLISLACTQFLNASEVTNAIKNLSFCMTKIADTNQIDDETQKELDDLKRVINLLTGK